MNKWKLVLIILVGILAVILLCVFGVQGAQNTAFSLEEQVNTAQSDIKVQEKRRVDLVYNLADCVKQYDKHEAETLTAAYIIDFDKNTFEIYEGFNNTPLEAHDRFFGMVCPKYADKKNSSDIYYPVKLKKVFSLYDLPTVEEFLLELEPPDEREELYG